MMLWNGVDVAISYCSLFVLMESILLDFRRQAMSQQCRMMSSSESMSISEREVDAVLEACAGDARATIRALLIGQAFLQQELTRTQARISAGYCRVKTHGVLQTPGSVPMG
ncbi:hypothetical protein ACT6QH_01495 [Xanthobacter sp. TB0139]|uniref:hypothetical protein n=1 Tax=Xanthobacter sp. TB0139 TaxID=3459178 RepID=UPI004039A5AA